MSCNKDWISVIVVAFCISANECWNKVFVWEQSNFTMCVPHTCTTVNAHDFPYRHTSRHCCRYLCIVHWQNVCMVASMIAQLKSFSTFCGWRPFFFIHVHKIAGQAGQPVVNCPCALIWREHLGYSNYCFWSRLNWAAKCIMQHTLHFCALPVASRHTKKFFVLL